MIIEGNYLVLEEKKGGEGKEGSNVIFGLQSLYDQAFKLDNTSLRDTGEKTKLKSMSWKEEGITAKQVS